jgi:NitT/TauT family transport system permease protein
MQTNNSDDLHSLEAGLDALQVGQKPHTSHPIWTKVLPPIIGIIVVLGLWQLAFMSHIKPDWALPSPSMVWDTLKTQWSQGVVWPSIENSLRRALTGFLMSIAIGTPLGLVVARVRPIRTALGPVLSGLQQLPSVAWVPAAVIWFGLTNSAIYMVVLLGAIPSIANGLISAVDQIPPLYLRAGKVMGARGFNSVRFILLPAALPGYLSGLEQGWAFAWRSLMAAELIAWSPQLGLGLGKLLETGRDLGDMSMVFSAIFLILLVGIAVERLGFAPVRKRILRNRGLLSS